MDNPETYSDPQGAADVTAASGQSESTETQSAEVSEAPIDGGTAETPAEQSLPWDQDARFKGKTAEDMFKIVQEADKYKGALSQKAKIADMLSAELGLTPDKIAEVISQRQNAQQQQYLQQNPLAAFQQELSEVKHQLIIEKEDGKLDQFLQAKPEFSEFRDEIRNLGYSVERDKGWDQIADKYFGRAIVKGQESAYKKIDTKTKTQAAGVSRGEPKTTFSIDELKNMSASEMEKVLPHKAV